MIHNLTHGECYQCGWIGSLQDTKDHPLRPMPADTMCPACGADVDRWITEAEAEAKLAEYED